MTTLLSKGLELEQSFKKNIENAQSQFKKELESRGLRLSAADFAALIEEISPTASRAALSSALEFMKPFTAGLGLRVSHLSDTQVEVVIPMRSRNLNEAGHLHESILLAAGTEACRLLLHRHAPLGRFQVETQSVRLDLLREISQEARVRWELNETSRETAFSELRQKREARIEASLRLMDEQEQTLADLTLSLRLTHVPALESSETSR